MTTRQQMERLAALEAAARAERMEADLEAMRPELVEMAKEHEISFDAFMLSIREAYQRVEEIGEEAYLEEVAAECGCTVEELRSGEFSARMDRELAEWKEQDRARRAEVIVWHGGNPPIPYRNGEIVRDANGEPLKFR